jgi:hypothetical protein
MLAPKLRRKATKYAPVASLSRISMRNTEGALEYHLNKTGNE